MHQKISSIFEIKGKGVEREKVATPKPPLWICHALRCYVKRCMQAERPCVRRLVTSLDLPLPMLLVVGGIAVKHSGQMSPRMNCKNAQHLM